MTTAAYTQSHVDTLRWSEPTVIKTAIYLQKTREIKTMDKNGIVRICKIDRCDITHARAMWKFLKESVDAGWQVSFGANGGYSPDRWFCDCVAEVTLD